MNDVVTRYEFRTFAQTFGLVAENIRRLSPCEDICESAETYLISPFIQKHNVKVRRKKLEIKQLIEDAAG